VFKRPTNDFYAAATYSPSASESSTKEQLIININSNNKKRKLSNSSANDDLDDYFELRNWNLNEKVNDLTSYNKSNFVQYLDAKEFTYSKVQQNGFQTPVVFKDKSGLDMRTPSKIFTVNDIKTCVGSKRVIDVIDCSTQKNFQMTMKEWCEYYENTNRDRILNVISLEFSHTKLEDYVEPPLIVRQLDWIETAWPKQLRLAQTDATNSLEKMKYPKVQKYVLMSVAECFTDFHIDMGGTSVWYHVLKGEKIFWLIPPTDKNLEIYQKWILTGNQSEQFLPDLVDDCQRIVLQQGWTFMLPSGWIHGVYTSKDSIVFGGNFLHSFNIEMQLKIYKIETKTKVPDTYRYPFYLKMIWFLIERYVHCFTGITHLDSSCHLDLTTFSNIKQQIAYKTFEPELLKNNLTQFELNGLIKLKEFLSNIKNNVNTAPNEIIDANLLFSKFIDIIDKQPDNTLGSVIPVKNEPFIHWPKMEKKYLKKIQSAFNSSFSSNDTNSSNNIRKHIMRNIPRTKGSIKKRLRPQNLPRSNVERRRRVRCKITYLCLILNFKMK
jgi:F-box and leucine-rich repeat protein 10/11